VIAELTIAELIDYRAAQTPRHVVFRSEGRNVSCQQLALDVNRIANGLTAAGLARRDRVGTMLYNGPGHAATMLAIMRLGLIWVPINYRLKGASLSFLLTHADPALLIVDEEFANTVTVASVEPRRIVSVRADMDLVGTLAAFAGASASSDPPQPVVKSDDVVAISYTSGTTGEPKGVQLTDRVFRACAWGVQATLRADPGDVLFHWEPIHHIAGNQVIIYALMEEVTLAMQRQFSASRFWTEVRESRARYAHYVGSVLQILLEQRPGPLERDHGASVLWGGGCPREIWDVVTQRFGVELREVWGMTETASITTVNIGGPKGSVGKALEHFDVAIWTLDGAGFAPTGVSGQLVVRERAPGVLTPGYFRNPDATAALYRDGWLQTGDMAAMDAQGHVYFQGRLKDSLRCRGENVSAWEVEAVLNTHPAVVHAAVIGVPCDLGEEDVKAFVKVHEPAHFLPAQLISWCAERMAPYQIPRYVAVISEFETTPTNRIRKELLPRSTTDCFDREAGVAASRRTR
jgi:crotonobetaine/carnitine-CoA ligase